MADLREAARRVLERWDSPAWTWGDGPTADLMADLRAAIASEPAESAEPVAWKCSRCGAVSECEGVGVGDNWCSSCGACECMTPLYAAPPAKRKPLTTDRLQLVMADHFGGRELTDDEAESAEAFARAVERAHNITGD